MIELSNSNVGALPGLDLQFIIEKVGQFFFASLRIGAFLLSSPLFGARFVLLPVRIGIVMTILKAYLLVFIAILLRWTTPRVRIDQLLDLGWKFLLPISLANLLLTAGLKLAFPQFFGG